MDPQACLTRYWNAVEEDDYTEACEAFNALRAWLDRGGFEPDWTANGYNRADFFEASHLEINAEPVFEAP